MLRRTVLGVLAFLTVLMPSRSFSAAHTPSPPGAEAFIIWPPDGAVITGGKLWVRMGLRNMGVCPKGVNIPNVGHHHLLIDTELPPFDPSQYPPMPEVEIDPPEEPSDAGDPANQDELP